MRLAIGIACIKRCKILLVKKRDFWILPGGKPLPGETDHDCIMRETGEELPGARIKIGRLFGTVEGTTPHRGDTLQCKVYLAEIEGEITPAAEISEAYWATDPRCFSLSDITRKIINKLAAERYLL